MVCPGLHISNQILVHPMPSRGIIWRLLRDEYPTCLSTSRLVYQHVLSSRSILTTEGPVRRLVDRTLSKIRLTGLDQKHTVKLTLSQPPVRIKWIGIAKLTLLMHSRMLKRTHIRHLTHQALSHRPRTATSIANQPPPCQTLPHNTTNVPRTARNSPLFTATNVNLLERRGQI